MKSIAQKIEKIYESKLAIKNSLLKKGIQVDNVFSNYASAIDSINVGASIFTSEEELNTSENKQEGNLAIVYNASNSTAPIVFKVVDTAQDIYILDGKELHIPNLNQLLNIIDLKTSTYAIQFNPSNDGYNMNDWGLIVVPDINFYFYDEVSSFDSGYRDVWVANPNNYAITFREYRNGSTQYKSRTIPAGASDNPSVLDLGVMSTYRGQTYYYINTVLYTDKNKTSIKFNSSTLEKVSNLQYTQLS